MKKLTLSKTGGPTQGSTAQCNQGTTAIRVSSAAATNQTPQGTLRSTTNHDHPDRTNLTSLSTNRTDRIDMVALSENQGIHKVTQTAINRIEITNQVTIREVQRIQ